MPPEPKRPIEELMEASAKARRAEFGVDPAMPNPMRTRLHEEIARSSGAEQRRENRNWFGLSWPQLSIGTALAAALVTAGVLWLGHEGKRSGAGNMTIAMQPVAAPERANPVDALKSLDAPAQAAAASEALAKTETDVAVTAGVLGGKAMEETSEEFRGQVASRARADFAAVSAAPVAPVAAASGAISSSADGSAGLPADGARLTQNTRSALSNGTQRFSQTNQAQVLRNNSNASQSSNLLNNFQFEQKGAAVRVVDADGSTYTGNFEPNARRAEIRNLKDARAAAAPARDLTKAASESAAAKGENFFRAVGYNASLKKEVVFEGNYIPLLADKKDAAKAKMNEEATQIPARIIGKAKVAGEPALEVDAATIER